MENVITPLTAPELYEGREKCFEIQDLGHSINEGDLQGRQEAFIIYALAASRAQQYIRIRAFNLPLRGYGALLKNDNMAQSTVLIVNR